MHTRKLIIGAPRALWSAVAGVVATLAADRPGVLTRVGDRVIDLLGIEEPSGPRSPGEAVANHRAR